MFSQMDMLTAATKIDQNIDPDAGHMLPHSGDMANVTAGFTQQRRVNSLDLVAIDPLPKDHDRFPRPGTYDATETVQWLDPNAPVNLNNQRVAERMGRDRAKYGDGSAEHHKPTGKPPRSDESEGASNHPDPIEGSNRDESGGANVGAQGGVAKADETVPEPQPPAPAQPPVWRPQAS